MAWYGSAYFLCFGGFQSAFGKAFKYFPLKETFLLSVFIFEIGSLLCGVAPNSTAFIIGRAIAGFGGAGIAIGGTVILAFVSEPKKRPMFMGLVGVTYTIAAIVGPLLGGAFADRVTWRWCFYINLPVGGVAIPLMYFFFHTPKHAKPVDAPLKEKLLQMDPVGCALAMGAIISYLLALQYAGITHAWNSSVVIGLLVGCVAIFVAMGFWEVYQGEYAMLPVRLVTKRSIWAPGSVKFFFAGCYFLLLYYLPIYFQSIKGKTAIESGVANLPLVVAGCLAILGGGIAVTTTRHATPFSVIFAAVTTVGCGLLYTLDVDTSTAKWIGYQILLGVGIAFPFQNGLNIAQAWSTAEDMSTTTSTLYCTYLCLFFLKLGLTRFLVFQIIGGAFSISAAQSAFANTLLKRLAETAPEIPPLLVIGTGAGDLASVFSPEQLPLVISAYMDGIRVSFAVALAMAGVSFLLAFLQPWKRLPSGGGDMMVMA